MENKQIKGAVGPLLGVLGESPVNGDHSPDEVPAGNPPSAGTGCLEASGRASGMYEGKKRSQKFLESVAQGLRGEKEGFARKGSKGARKWERYSHPEGVQDIRKWFEARGEATGQTQGKNKREKQGGFPDKEAS